MTTANISSKALPTSRINQLINELNYAIKHTDQKTLSNWGIKTAKIFIHSLKRRGIGFINAIKFIISGTAKETTNAILAAKEGKLKKHLTGRTIDASIEISRKKDLFIQNIKIITNRLKTNPSSAAPELLVAIIGFYLGSGGLDGDGGIPDLDLELGIGAHRSIWFHSILPGATVEAAVFSLATLVNSIHLKLPDSHDEIWDRLVAEYNRISVAFASGTCAGLAYHLFIDATWDAGKAYSDLPFSTTMEGHQAIMGTNAAVECIDLKEDKSKEG